MSGGEASHFRGRSSLYKPAKAGYTGHSLPTVTSSPARRHTLRAAGPLHKDSGLALTLGGRAQGAPLLTSRYLFHGAGSLKNLGLSQLQKGENSFKKIGNN
ncbi:hypothetical protein R6Z07F_002048 [Ovis aries]